MSRPHPSVMTATKQRSPEIENHTWNTFTDSQREGGIGGLSPRYRFSQFKHGVVCALIWVSTLPGMRLPPDVGSDQTT